MWYSASILLKSTITTEDGAMQPGFWEDCIVLIEAQSEAIAEKLASDLGRSKESTYLNSDGEKVSWMFVEVNALRDLVHLSEIKSGSEVFSRFLKPREAESLMADFEE